MRIPNWASYTILGLKDSLPERFEEESRSATANRGIAVIVVKIHRNEVIVGFCITFGLFKAA